MFRIFIAFAIFAKAGLAIAEDGALSDQAIIAQRVDDYSAAMKSADYEKLITFLPPAIRAHIVQSAQVSDDEARQMMVDGMKQVFDVATMDAFFIDGSNARIFELEGGYAYALHPATLSVSVDDRQHSMITQTLAICDGGKWYLASLKQAAVLQEMYLKRPGFSGGSYL